MLRAHAVHGGEETAVRDGVSVLDREPRVALLEHQVVRLGFDRADRGRAEYDGCTVERGQAGGLAVDRNPPANSGDTTSIPDMRRFHML